MLVELETLTIRSFMERSFSLFAAQDAISFVGERALTFQGVQHKVYECARTLLECQVHKGNRVVILGENSPNWVISYLATVYIGAVAVPILTGFPESDTRHIIRNCQAVAAFTTEKQHFKIEEMQETQLQCVISLEDLSIENIKDAQPKPLEQLVQSLKKKNGEAPSTVQILNELDAPAEDDLAAIIYTSGTTGHSKGVMLTHKNITSDVVNSIEQFPIDSKDRFLSILPLPHTFECTGGMLCPFAAGSSIAYMKGLPTPKKLLAAMEVVQPTAVLTVPLVMDKIYRKNVLPVFESKKILKMLYRIPFFRKQLNKAAGKKVQSSFGGKLRFFMFGGAALNMDIEQFLIDAEIQYSTGYGMTETSPIMTINPFGHVRRGSCGQPIPGIEMKIHEPDPTTGVGEIILRGSIIMQGYYKNETATKESFIDNEWLRTGDLGYFDDENYLFIKGRSKNVIIGPSGENIYPEIIEQELAKNQYIAECVVFQKEGNIVALAYLDYDAVDTFVNGEAKDGNAAEQLTLELLEDIRRSVNTKLPKFSAINKITEHPEPFQKTPTNKVKRYLYISAN